MDTIKNSSELEKLLGITAEEKAGGVNVWIELVDASATMSAADKAATHTFTFGTDRFSSYALAYKDGVASAPKTGDTTNMYQWILLMVVGFGMVCVAYLKKRIDI